MMLDRADGSKLVTFEEVLNVIEPFFASPIPRTSTNPEGSSLQHTAECIERLRDLRDKLVASEVEDS